MKYLTSTLLLLCSFLSVFGQGLTRNSVTTNAHPANVPSTGEALVWTASLGGYWTNGTTSAAATNAINNSNGMGTNTTIYVLTSATNLFGQGTNYFNFVSLPKVAANTFLMTDNNSNIVGFASGVLTNLVGTAARNVTNVVSLSTTNATSKPLTNSYTAGVLTLFGLEQGSGHILTVTSNIVVAADWAQIASTTNVVGVSNWVNAVSNYVSASNLQTNNNQFGPNVVLNIKDGANLTNLIIRGMTNTGSFSNSSGVYVGGVLQVGGQSTFNSTINVGSGVDVQGGTAGALNWGGNETLGGSLTLTPQTASTILSLNGSKAATSVANGIGMLTNDGAGVFGWMAIPAGGGFTEVWTNNTDSAFPSTYRNSIATNFFIGTNGSVWAGNYVTNFLFPNTSSGRPAGFFHYRDWTRDSNNFSGSSYASKQLMLLATNGPYLAAFDYDSGAAMAGQFLDIYTMTNNAVAGLIGLDIATGGSSLTLRSHDGTASGVQTFQVDALGDLKTIKKLTYTWPSAHSTGMMTNDGAGILGWMAIPSGGAGSGVQTNANQFAPNVVLNIKSGALVTNLNTFGLTNIGTFTNSSTADIAGSTRLWGSATIEGNVLINGGDLTHNALTGDTMLKANSSKQVVSVANSAGMLTNNGAGIFGWMGIPAGGGGLTSIDFTNQLWVDKVGDNTTGQRNRMDKPFKDVRMAISNAVPGDVINIGVGEFFDSGGIVVSNGITLRGIDSVNTVLSGTNGSIATGPHIVPRDNVTIENLSIKTREHIANLVAIPFGWTVINTNGFTNVLVQNVSIRGFTDAVLISQTNDNQITFKNCEFIVNATNGPGGDNFVWFGTTNSYCTLIDCDMISIGRTNATRGAELNGGVSVFKNCRIISTNYGDQALGVQLLADHTKLRMINCSIDVFSTNTITAITSTATNPVQLIGCFMNTNQVTGYVSQYPLFVSGIAPGTSITTSTNSSGVVTINSTASGSGDTIWTNIQGAGLSHVRPIAGITELSLFFTNNGGGPRITNNQPDLWLSRTNGASYQIQGTTLDALNFAESGQGTRFILQTNGQFIVVQRPNDSSNAIFHVVGTSVQGFPHRFAVTTNGAAVSYGNASGTPTFQMRQADDSSYNEFTLPAGWLPTNKLVLTLTNVAAGEFLKVQAVSVSGGVATILLTNGVGSAGSGSLQTNANQFAPNVVLNIKDGALLTNIVSYGWTNNGNFSNSLLSYFGGVARFDTDIRQGVGGNSGAFLDVLRVADQSHFTNTITALTNAQFKGTNYFNYVALPKVSALEILRTDGSSNIASVSTGTGMLTNNGSGAFGWMAIPSGSGSVTSSDYFTNWNVLQAVVGGDTNFLYTDFQKRTYPGGTNYFGTCLYYSNHIYSGFFTQNVALIRWDADDLSTSVQTNLFQDSIHNYPMDAIYSPSKHKILWLLWADSLVTTFSILELQPDTMQTNTTALDTMSTLVDACKIVSDDTNLWLFGTDPGLSTTMRVSQYKLSDYSLVGHLDLTLRGLLLQPCGLSDANLYWVGITNGHTTMFKAPTSNMTNFSYRISPLTNNVSNASETFGRMTFLGDYGYFADGRGIGSTIFPGGGAIYRFSKSTLELECLTLGKSNVVADVFNDGRYLWFSGSTNGVLAQTPNLFRYNPYTLTVDSVQLPTTNDISMISGDGTNRLFATSFVPNGSVYRFKAPVINSTAPKWPANGSGMMTNDGNGTLGWMTIPSGGSGNLTTNANQFGANTTLNIKSGALVTNLNTFGLTNIGVFTNSSTADIAGSTRLWGSATIEGNVLINGGDLTHNALTASTMLYGNSSKQVVSLANGTGVLTNNGSGTVGYMAISSLPSGGGGGTNFPPIIGNGGGKQADTNITVGVGVRQVRTIVTNASFALVFTGTPLNGEEVEVGVSNLSSSAIYLTNTAGIFDPTVASNNTTFAIGGTSARWFTFKSSTNWNLGTQRWELHHTLGKEFELAAAGYIAFTTNAANSIITVSNGSVILGNLANTGAITNLISLSLSNNTIKPLVVGAGDAAAATNTTGIIRGLEAGANITLTPNGSNYVIASTGGSGSTNNVVEADGNFILTNSFFNIWNTAFQGPVATTNYLYATNGDSQFYNLFASTNIQYVPYTGAESSNHVGVDVVFTQNSTGGYYPTNNGQVIPVNTNASRSTMVTFFVYANATNFSVAYPMSMGLPQNLDGIEWNAASGTYTNRDSSGTGAFVRTNAPIMRNATVQGSFDVGGLLGGVGQARIDQAIVTNGIGLGVGFARGTGGANTNFVVVMPNGTNIIYFDAGTTNVHLALTNMDSILSWRGTIILTNRTATARTLSLNSVFFNWISLQKYDGISAPFTITNSLAGRFEYETLGTNVQYSFKPMDLPTN